MDVKRVNHVQFGVLNPTEIREMSVVKVEHAIGFVRGVPHMGGLMDPRMGAVGNMACSTCDGLEECPGHFGHIELSQPMYHYGFIRHVNKILQCICYTCSRILCASDPGYANALKISNAKRRFDVIHMMCLKHQTCAPLIEKEAADEQQQQQKNVLLMSNISGCGSSQPKIIRDGFHLYAEFEEPTEESGTKRQLLRAAKALEILKRVCEADCASLGFSPRFSRPDWMILTVLPVPPPCIRPSTVPGSSARGDDDLTIKLAEILRANIDLRRREERGCATHMLDESAMMLQYHIATFFDNEIPGQPQDNTKGGRPLKSLRQRLKGKEGRIRGNLMGKRVDFSARTVITPDPNIAIDQVGVPPSIAANLTFPETVTPFNISRMRELVKRGPNDYPGATCIIRTDGSRVDLRHFNNVKPRDIHLDYGYVVERHIRDGDYVVFNRQPSLHKMSMMGHRVKVMPGSSFRLNLSVTTPYNADFDGDEMNLHVPQSLECRAEVQQLMAVPNQIITPASNRPIMSIVQDALLGSSLMTSRNTFIERDLAMNLIMWMSNFDGRMPIPAVLKPRKLWTGKQLFSMILPNINMEPQHSFPSPPPVAENLVLIDQGELLTGVLDSKTLGRTNGGIIHIIWKDHGPEVTKQFMCQCQYVVNAWLLEHGFSVGIGDTIADSKTALDINQTLTQAKESVKKLVDDAQSGNMEPLPGRTMEESFEVRVNRELNSAVDKAGKSALSSLGDTNNVKKMVTAGSKGSFINISQMIACVGQQNVEGKRVPFGFRNRTLPHFTKDDNGPESRGFVQNSYLSGLTPQEFFFHAMGGREGIIDTACKTSDTGYIQRKLMKAMEDIQCKYDGTVRSSTGDVIQFLYGEDGMDGVHIEKQTLDTIKLGDAELSRRYEFDFADPDTTREAMDPEVVADIRSSQETQQILAGEYAQIKEDRRFIRDLFSARCEDSVSLPVNVKRLILNAQKIFHINGMQRTELHPKKVVEGINWLKGKLSVVEGSDAISSEVRENSTMLFCALLRSTLASKRVVLEYRLTPHAFEWVIGEVEARFDRSLVHPGEMVGPIAAQSIGEPATQMTLNTFHYAGVSAKNVTLGVPRLKEILNVSQHIKTPTLTIFLDKSCSKDMAMAKLVQCELEYCTLVNVTESTEIYYDPDPTNTVVASDREFVKLYLEMPDEEFPVNHMGPWLLRIKFNREAMTDKNLTMADVSDKIYAQFGKDLNIIASDDNANDLVMHIRVSNEDESQKKESNQPSEFDSAFMRTLEAMLLSNLTLLGISEIKKVFMRNEKTASFNGDNAFVADSEEEWILDTEGTNLREVMCHPLVDANRTFSNDIVETQHVLGIEAARNVLQRELNRVISFDGSYINVRHLLTLADVMTAKGNIMAITRHGINCTDAGALMRASFEESVEQLITAAAFSEKDELKGVSQNIILGQLGPAGTGSFDLLLDANMLKNALQMPGVEEPIMFDYDIAPSPDRSETLSASPLYSPRAGFGSPSSYDMDGDEVNASFSPEHESCFSGAIGIAQKSRIDSLPSSPAYSTQDNDAYCSDYLPSSPMWTYSIASPSYTGNSDNNNTNGNFPFSYSSPTTNKVSAATAAAAASPYFHSSPVYSPSSPAYSPMEGVGSAATTYSPSSPSYRPLPYNEEAVYSQEMKKYNNPTSPSYSPSSSSIENRGNIQAYSPTSPSIGGYENNSSPTYSPTSPAYSPSSSALTGGPGASAWERGYMQQYSPASPSYSPMRTFASSPSSPTYTPASSTETYGKHQPPTKRKCQHPIKK